MFDYVVLANPFECDSWLVCRRTQHGWTTAESEHGTWESADKERRRLLGEQDKKVNAQRYDPDRPFQMVLGFYGPEQGDA